MQGSNSILNNIEVNQDNGSCALVYYWLTRMPPSLFFFSGDHPAGEGVLDVLLHDEKNYLLYIPP